MTSSLQSKPYIGKIQKFLKRLLPQEQLDIIELIERILSDNVTQLDVKKLKGHKDIYQVRTGTIRIIFQKTSDDIIILEISRRSEKTYRGYLKSHLLHKSSF